jgi:alpha-tubulin suppressor-like RCC1 family protein
MKSVWRDRSRGRAYARVVVLVSLSMVAACQANPSQPFATPSASFTPTIASSPAPPSVGSQGSAGPRVETTAVTVGNARACILRSDGSVACWAQRISVALVPGISDATAVATGTGYTCALRSGGGVLCWGLNDQGQLGNGTLTKSTDPVPVVRIDDAKAITVGDLHTCALRSTGHVMCWGLNTFGQAGGQAGTNSMAPVAVSGIADATAIAAGGSQTCALRVGGSVACWGIGRLLGNGASALGGGSSPVPVSGIAHATAIAAGKAGTCALLVRGSVTCWGLNSWGQLGDPSIADIPTPLAVPGISDAIAISVGDTHSCAVRAGGGVVCWGDNFSGELGDGTTTASATLVSVSGITAATSVAAGLGYTCVLSADGSVRCWGWSEPPSRPVEASSGGGQPSAATPSASPTGSPAEPSGAPIVASPTLITAGEDHTCTVTSGQGVRCWGMNLGGELGNGSRSSSLIPVDVAGLTSGVSGVEAGDFHTCALTTAGGVKCWGSNAGGVLGNGSTTVDSLVPVDVAGLATGVAAIAAGQGYTCALTTGGGVKCWGSNSAGQLGNGSTTDSPAPVDVVGLTSGVTAIAASDIHTCALTSTGGVKCWGDNTFGRLGTVSTSSSLVPVDVAGLTSGVTGIAAGYDFTCAITTDGGVKCWGLNDGGELGDGTGDTSYTAVSVVGLTHRTTEIAAGNGHTCALSIKGGVECWGLYLGNGSTSLSYTAVPVPALKSGVEAIAAGKNHTCALMSAGGIKCWGGNSFGQLGDGTKIDRRTPVDVSGF